MPPHLFRDDPLLAERVKAARTLLDAMAKNPADPVECNRLADRLFQLCSAPAVPATRQ
jgi:hypothetical protein